MDQSSWPRIMSVVCVAGLMLTMAANDAAAKLRGKVSIDGSSTVYPITEAVAEEFGDLHPRVRVTVGISGTGGGFKRFAIGETDISNASRPIKKKELDYAAANGVEFVEIPVAYDGLTIVVHKENNWCASLTIEQLQEIFLDGSTVQTWQDLHADWPAQPIKIYAPGTDSGTFDYFKHVIAGKTGSIRSDMSVSEDDNVLIRGVAGQKGGIGFFGCAYYYANQDKLKAVPIDNGNGPTLPTSENIQSGAYSPFSRPLMIYVNTQSLERPQVRAFIEFYLEHGPDLAQEVGYVKLPSVIYDRATERVRQERTGTCFIDEAGNQVTGALTEIYQ